MWGQESLNLIHTGCVASGSPHAVKKYCQAAEESMKGTARKKDLAYHRRLL